LSICVTVGFFGILFYIIRYGLPTSGSEALLMMLGALGTAWTGVMSFYFGSSAGSQRKDNTIHQALNGK